MKPPLITSAIELEQLINEVGFLPLFKSEINGFSVEDCTPSDLWFVDGVEGPWEWREIITEKGEIAYGKLFNKKTGFVSRRWYPDLANYRRNGYDFDARYEDGLSSYECKIIVDLLQTKDSFLSKEIKNLLGFKKDWYSGFETAMTTLQMQTYVTVKCFEYKVDKFGRPYGWSAARYSLSEKVFGEDFVTSRYNIVPKESKELLEEHIYKLFPNSTKEQIAKIIR
ncbi:hypothetical protein IAI10_09810 [Clostridium sp. 19966]|uniref:AlkZ-related protein n=1 Tax=Clostridium sp. 19966 TaxID=2768166 RepID=UPI0028DE3EE1|nr:hypothetical protein [Clostridium sp. 19966]MDT8716953.1 hypothetical protein [Clostridium sp. 19966]